MKENLIDNKSFIYENVKFHKSFVKTCEFYKTFVKFHKSPAKTREFHKTFVKLLKKNKFIIHLKTNKKELNLYK